MAKTDIVDLGAARANRGTGHKLAQRTYLDADGKATTDRTKGVTLLGPAGRVISGEAARQAGLGPKKGDTSDADKAATADGDKAAESKPTKRRTKSEDKTRKASEDK